MCAHVAHQAHGRFSNLFLKKSDFLEFMWISKIFPNFFFVKNRQNIVSFRSYVRLRKIEAIETILEHFENFDFLTKIGFLKFFKNFEKSKNFKMLQNRFYCFDFAQTSIWSKWDDVLSIFDKKQFWNFFWKIAHVPDVHTSGTQICAPQKKLIQHHSVPTSHLAFSNSSWLLLCVFCRYSSNGGSGV